MKTVLVVLLILAAGAGAWFSGLSGLFGINGQYEDFKEMISYRKTLDKEIRTWTSLRNDMIKNRGLADEKKADRESVRCPMQPSPLLAMQHQPPLCPTAFAVRFSFLWMFL